MSIRLPMFSSYIYADHYISTSRDDLTAVISHQYVDTHASSQGQIDVLLRTVSKLGSAQRLLPGRQVQQEQHGAAGQVVQ